MIAMQCWVTKLTLLIQVGWVCTQGVWTYSEASSRMGMHTGGLERVFAVLCPLGYFIKSVVLPRRKIGRRST